MAPCLTCAASPRFSDSTAGKALSSAASATVTPSPQPAAIAVARPGRSTAHRTTPAATARIAPRESVRNSVSAHGTTAAHANARQSSGRSGSPAVATPSITPKPANMPIEFQ